MHSVSQSVGCKLYFRSLSEIRGFNESISFATISFLTRKIVMDDAAEAQTTKLLPHLSTVT